MQQIYSNEEANLPSGKGGCNLKLNNFTLRAGLIYSHHDVDLLS